MDNQEPSTPYNLRTTRKPSLKIQEAMELLQQETQYRGIQEDRTSTSSRGDDSIERTTNSPPSPTEDVENQEDDENIISTTPDEDNPDEVNPGESTSQTTTPGDMAQSQILTILQQMREMIQQTNLRNDETRKAIQETNQNVQALSSYVHAQFLEAQQRRKETREEILYFMTQQFLQRDGEIAAKLEINNEKITNMEEDVAAHKQNTIKLIGKEINNFRITTEKTMDQHYNQMMMNKEENKEVKNLIHNFREETLNNMNHYQGTTESKITQLNQHINECHSLLMDKEQNPESKGYKVPQTIQVTCTNNIPLDHNPPLYNGRDGSPKEFLEQLRKYYNKVKARNTTNQTETETLHDLIEVSLEQHALQWWQLTKNQIINWDHFEEQFLGRYWSREVQRNIRQRLELGRYRPGRLSRAEYFIEKVIIMKSLSPTPTDEEIIDCLSEHFSDLIQDARRVQNTTTIHGFELLLQREDMLDRQNEMKPRNQNQHQPTNSQKKNYNNPPQKFTHQQNQGPHNPDSYTHRFNQNSYRQPQARNPNYNPNQPHHRGQNFRDTKDRPYPYSNPQGPNQYQPPYHHQRAEACHMIAEPNPIPQSRVNNSNPGPPLN